MNKNKWVLKLQSKFSEFYRNFRYINGNLGISLIRNIKIITIIMIKNIWYLIILFILQIEVVMIKIHTDQTF